MSIVTTPGNLVRTIQRGGRDWPIYEETPELLALLELRKETLELTLAEAAARAGETVRQWYEIERGARIPVDAPALHALLATGGTGHRYEGRAQQGGGSTGGGARVR